LSQSHGWEPTKTDSHDGTVSFKLAGPGIVVDLARLLVLDEQVARLLVDVRDDARLLIPDTNALISSYAFESWTFGGDVLEFEILLVLGR
jgi:hypothetical protein